MVRLALCCDVCFRILACCHSQFNIDDIRTLLQMQVYGVVKGFLNIHLVYGIVKGFFNVQKVCGVVNGFVDVSKVHAVVFIMFSRDMELFF